MTDDDPETEVVPEPEDEASAKVREAIERDREAEERRKRAEERKRQNEERLDQLEKGLAAVRVRLKRIGRAWRGLDNEQRFAGFAALGLLVTMFLPWYEKSVVSDGKKVKDSISAFGDVTFVEASIFLVAAGVLLLLLARGEGRKFALPGGDGMVIRAAGGWSALLIFYRIFDKPSVSGDGATVGIQWGFLLAFVAAGLVTYGGHRLRLREKPLMPATDPESAEPPDLGDFDVDNTGETRIAPPDGDPVTEATQVARPSRRRRRPPPEPDPSDIPEPATEAGRRRGSDRAVTREDAEALKFDEPEIEEPFKPRRRLEPGEIPSARDRRS